MHDVRKITGKLGATNCWNGVTSAVDVVNVTGAPTTISIPTASATAAFTYGTQHVPRQTMQFLGTEARLEVEVPFNAPNDRPCRLFLYDAGDGLGGAVAEVLAFVYRTLKKVKV